MIRRFSLYGFLKNQQYYDYSLVLAFLAMGLDYATIGLLVGIREAATAVMEIPSGVLADRTGRRRALLVSLVSYILSFALFGALGLAAEAGRIANGPLVASLAVAMALFAVGEAFRSGTHKAMIFAWLRAEGRTDERVEVYGHTRSMAKLGSAVSVVIACTIIWWTGDFVSVFFFAIIPYLLNLLNIATYPASLDSIGEERVTARSLVRDLVASVRRALTRSELRRLLAEDMGFDGFFKVSKGYLQPILLTAALPLSAHLLGGLELNEAQRSVVLLGPVYVALFLLSATASRHAHRLVAPGRSPDAAAHRIWMGSALVFALIAWALWSAHAAVAIAGFALFYVLQNLWRPLLLSRLDQLSDVAEAATMLSVESQARSLFSLVLAPSLGLLVDLAGGEPGGLWPVPLVGLGLALVFAARGI
ncbi:MAG TPA: MFS transporter [Planctomycetes bacterium]|nr:MFS transporter [Planctomycetota bacterium]